jgi:alpha-methylacyl-CoA racemase
MNGPLAGVTVIELAGLGPVPFCGMMLGDMGADVIRVDRTESSDLGIAFPAEFDLRNRNKRSVALDLKHPQGLATLKRIVSRADILIEGFRPGVAEKLGIGPEVCHALNAQLVYGRGTGWGQEGPLALTAGHDINYIALTGALDMIGPEGAAPVVPLNLVGDYGGGAAYLAYGVMCALFSARRTGQGQVVDAAMVDGVTSLLTTFHALRQSGQLHAERGTNVLDGGAPYYTTYATRDGRHIAIGAIEPRFYRALISRLGLDPAAIPAQDDRSRWPVLRATLADCFARRTRDEWAHFFADCPDACFSPVLTLAEANDHPHMRQRASLVQVGGVDHPQPAPRLSHSPGSIRRTAPHPGEHTRDILGEFGLTTEEIETGLTAGAFVAAV